MIEQKSSPLGSFFAVWGFMNGFTRWWRGAERFFIKANVLFCVPKENQKSTSDFDALDPRERGCSPLSDPEGVVETEKS